MYIKNKLYENITVDERIQLTVAALARYDAEEIQRLHSTCDKRKYLMTNAAYTDKIKSIEKFLSVFALMSGQICSDIFSAETGIWGSHFARVAYHTGFNKASQLNNTPEAAKMDDLKHIDAAERAFQEKLNRHVNQLKSLYQSFLEICSSERLNAEHLLQWFSVFEQLPELKRYLATDNIGTQEYATEYKQLLIGLLDPKNDPA